VEQADPRAREGFPERLARITGERNGSNAVSGDLYFDATTGIHYGWVGGQWRVVSQECLVARPVQERGEGGGMTEHELDAIAGATARRDRDVWNAAVEAAAKACEARGSSGLSQHPMQQGYDAAIEGVAAAIRELKRRSGISCYLAPVLLLGSSGCGHTSRSTTQGYGRDLPRLRPPHARARDVPPGQLPARRVTMGGYPKDIHNPDDWARFLARYLDNRVTNGVNDGIGLVALHIVDAIKGDAVAAMTPRWMPIETAPRDEAVLVYAPCREDLGPIVTMCLYHPDAGWCVDEIREVTHWMLVPDAPEIKP
jgi:hypothetical protein